MYTKDQINNIIRRCAKVRGKEWCLLKLAEECDELSAAILQKFTKDGSEANIQKEMADVEIAIDILKIIYSNKIIDTAKQNKLERIDRKNNEIIYAKKVNKTI
jgi:NTP pyrophosphatase (non-canonical NTP hydrolase)